MKIGPKAYQVVPLEENENKFESYSYWDEMILGTWFIDSFQMKKKKTLR